MTVTSLHKTNDNSIIWLTVLSCFVIIVDAPRKLHITQSIYRPGDRIRCLAEGNPAPFYRWTNVISGTVTQGDVFVISEDMVGNNYTFECTAINQLHSNSVTFSFAVKGIIIFVSLWSISQRKTSVKRLFLLPNEVPEWLDMIFVLSGILTLF